MPDRIEKKCLCMPEVFHRQMGAMDLEDLKTSLRTILLSTRIADLELHPIIFRALHAEPIKRNPLTKGIRNYSL